jgi:hypothetical protein
MRIKKFQIANQLFTCLSTKLLAVTAVSFALLAATAFSSPGLSYAATNRATTPQDFTSCNDSPGGYVMGIALYYAGSITCNGQASQIRDTFYVQILQNNVWTTKQTNQKTCNNCTALYSPTEYTTYTYTGSPGQKVRVSETSVATHTNGSRASGSMIVGPSYSRNQYQQAYMQECNDILE